MTESAVIFNIQRFSIHDGPGIRTTVFLKGCSLNCFWCHNPEGIHTKPEVLFYSDRCIYCGECLSKCEHSAHTINNNTHEYNRDLCVVCGDCIQFCYSDALELTGKTITAEDVFEEILKDKDYYASSGGGVTLSGGEPMLHSAFSISILKKCKAENIHTAIETSGNCRWSQIEEALPYTDLIMMDIKHLDTDKHKSATGVHNGLILENAERISEVNIPVIFRIPVIPTVNDAEEEIAAISGFVSGLQQKRKNKFGKDSAFLRLQLLKFHRLAGDKYRAADMQNRAAELPDITKERMSELKKCAASFDIDFKE